MALALSHANHSGASAIAFYKKVVFVLDDEKTNDRKDFYVIVKRKLGDGYSLA